MCNIFQENYTPDNKVVICNEGGTRSSKTWDLFHWIVAFCDHNRNQENEIYILRDTLTNCKDKTFRDFKKCMKLIGYSFKYFSEHQKPYVNILGNHVFFRGLDDEKNAEGYPSDILFINEALETQKSKVDGLKMRCRKAMILDWNPKFTDHWCFDLEGQPNTFFTRTNYKNNKHLQGSIVREIESYEPWLPGSYEIIDGTELHYNGQLIDAKNQPPPHPANINNNTADEFRWKVYGLGLRGAMKGVIFNNVRYIDEFPNIAHTYGLDFGFTNDPTALVRYSEDSTDIYLELLCYQPIETPQEIDSYMQEIDIERNVPITADSSDKYTSEHRGSVEMVESLYELGWTIDKVSKRKNVMFWLLSMKNKRINIVKNQFYPQAKKEQQNYIFKEINGIAINQPVDKFNHFWDAARYAHMAYNQETQEIYA